MKLALGTVQLGLDYGVSNKAGKVNINSAQALLTYAYENNITTLDTAAAYGNSEEVLGLLANKHTQIITKINPCESTLRNTQDILKNSLTKLNRSQVYAVLLHNADILLHPDSHYLLKQLEIEKNNGTVNKIGVSLYHPSQVSLFKIFKPDIVQIPLNILDQRFLENNLLASIQAQEIEVHVRSAFLQGLLLLEPHQRSNYFNQFKALMKFDGLIKELSVTRLEACLQFLKSIESIDKIVVGCCSAKELSEIISAFNAHTPINGLNFACFDEQLIVPSNWPK